MYYYEGMAANVGDIVVVNQQELVTIKSHTMNVELHLGTELHSSVVLQNEVEAHFDSKISVHDVDLRLVLTSECQQT